MRGSLFKVGGGVFFLAVLLFFLAQKLIWKSPVPHMQTTQEAERPNGASIAKTAFKSSVQDRNSQSMDYREPSNDLEVPRDSSVDEVVQHIGAPLERVDNYSDLNRQHIGVAMNRQDTYDSAEVLHIGANIQRLDDFSRSANPQHIGTEFNREDDYSSVDIPQHIGVEFNREDD
jgi:hypothetical protein